MAWLEITLNIPAGGAEDAAGMLTAAGFPELVIEDQTQFEDFLEENRSCWDYIDETLQQQLQGLSRIRLYLEDTDKAGLDKLLAIAREQDFPATVVPLKEENWEESWKDNYTAVETGEKLVVLPYWLAGEDHGSRLPVILDPGLTFGTGTHPSTQMVLQAMEERIQPGAACLDLGSGSGILSIAALRLGAAAATGVDIDPKAEDIARENAAYNGFSAPQFTALTGNVTADKKLMSRLAGDSYDVVLVNIVADVIIALSPVLPRFLSKKTCLICSGILDSRLQDVLSALENAGIEVQQVLSKDEWRCVIGKGRLP